MSKARRIGMGLKTVGFHAVPGLVTAAFSGSGAQPALVILSLVISAAVFSPMRTLPTEPEKPAACCEDKGDVA